MGGKVPNPKKGKKKLVDRDPTEPEQMTCLKCYNKYNIGETCDSVECGGRTTFITGKKQQAEKELQQEHHQYGINGNPLIKKIGKRAAGELKKKAKVASKK